MLCCISSFGQTDPLERIISTDQLKHDFEILASTLEENHPGLHLYSSPNEIHNVLHPELNKKEYTLREALTLLAAAVDQIHDGHTNLLAGDYITGDILARQKFFPFTLRIADGRAYVNHNFSEYDFLERGTEIVSINHQSIDEILAELKPFITCDGYDREAKLEQLEGQFWWYYGLRYGYRETFVIRYREYGSSDVKHLVNAALTYSDRFDMLSEVYGFDWEPDEKMSFTIHEDVAILTVNQFHGMSKVVYSAFLESTFKRMRKNDVEHLVIDIRKNGGGREGFENILFSYLPNEMICKYDEIYALNMQTESYAYLEHGGRNRIQDWLYRSFEYHQDGQEWKRRRPRFLSTLQPREQQFEGQVYLLVGGQVFSSAADFAAMCKEYVDNCSLIGTETLGGCVSNTSGYFYRLVLPHTGFEVEIPRVHFRLNIPADNPGGGVLPDYFVDFEIENFVNGLDGHLKLAYELIGRKERSQFDIETAEAKLH